MAAFDYRHDPASILTIFAILTNAGFLAFLIERAVYHTRRSDTARAQWPRHHMLIGSSVAIIFNLVITLLGLLRLLWSRDETYASCVTSATVTFVNRFICYVYLALLGLITLFQVCSPLTLIGKKQFRFWSRLHIFIWIGIIFIAAIVYSSRYGTVEYEEYGAKYCRITVTERTLYGLLVLEGLALLLPLCLLVLYALLSVLGLASRHTPVDTTPENAQLTWVVASRKMAVVFICILAICVVVIFIPLTVFPYLRYIYSMAIDEGRRFMDIWEVWNYLHVCFFLLFPFFCLVLDEVGIIQMVRQRFGSRSGEMTVTVTESEMQ